MNMFSGLTSTNQIQSADTESNSPDGNVGGVSMEKGQEELADPINPISPHESLSRWTELCELYRQINQDMRDYYEHYRQSY